MTLTLYRTLSRTLSIQSVVSIFIQTLLGERITVYVVDLFQQECKGDVSYVWTIQIELIHLITNYVKNSKLGFELESRHE